jgi:hypothetical protein
MIAITVDASVPNRVISMRVLSKGTIKIELNEIQKVGVEGTQVQRIKST